MSNIGFKIKKLREQNGLTQEDFAFKLDTTQSKICKIESGQTEKIDFNFMQKVCELFNVELDYFLDNNINQYNSYNENSAISIYGDTAVNRTSENVFQFLIENQKKITELLNAQNILINKILFKIH